MRPFERRAAGAYPYYRLARWNEVFGTWLDGKPTYETEELAQHAAKRLPGRYRISRYDAAGRTDLPPFGVSRLGSSARITPIS